MNIVLFIITVFISWLFSFMFTMLFPGGDSDSNFILSMIIFITGEIAVCTNIIIKKIDGLKK